jgi:hypothetical protein
MLSIWLKFVHFQVQDLAVPDRGHCVRQHLHPRADEFGQILGSRLPRRIHDMVSYPYTSALTEQASALEFSEAWS